MRAGLWLQGAGLLVPPHSCLPRVHLPAGLLSTLPCVPHVCAGGALIITSGAGASSSFNGAISMLSGTAFGAGAPTGAVYGSSTTSSAFAMGRGGCIVFL